MHLMLVVMVTNVLMVQMLLRYSCCYGYSCYGSEVAKIQLLWYRGCYDTVVIGVRVVLDLHCSNGTSIKVGCIQRALANSHLQLTNRTLQF